MEYCISSLSMFYSEKFQILINVDCILSYFNSSLFCFEAEVPVLVLYDRCLHFQENIQTI